MLKLTKSVQDLKVIRQIKLISNVKRVCRGTQTPHWTWSLDIEDRGVQCNMNKLTTNASNQTNGSTSSDTAEESDGEYSSDTTEASDETFFSCTTEASDETFSSGTIDETDDTFIPDTTDDTTDLYYDPTIPTYIINENENNMDTLDLEIEQWFNRIEF